jgi:glycerol-3-phosphate acyltransferase PlsX
MATELDRQALTLAVDAMGGDKGPEEIVKGCGLAIQAGLRSKLRLVGKEELLAPAVKAADLSAEQVSIQHTEGVVEMDDKPAKALRRSKDSSMWAAIEAVKSGEAAGVVSCGNTGALMAIARMRLKMIEGVDRPAASCLWPGLGGNAVVLDVGANVESDPQQLVQFAIMGEAYYRSLYGKKRPRVGLLNVGEEDLKGHTLIRNAAVILREADPDMDFIGFVEGDDISGGDVDVVVTDGFTGNIALKTAEGTARMIGSWVKEALTANLMSKAGAALMMPSLKKLKARMDPSSVNGAPLLGLDGLVVKSHGGSDAAGVKSALMMTEELAAHPFVDDIRRTVRTVNERAKTVEIEDVPTAAE